MGSKYVWTHDATEGYIKGCASEIGPDGKVKVIPLNSDYFERICTVQEIHPSCDQPQDLEDCCKCSVKYRIEYRILKFSIINFTGKLLYLNEATLLENLKTRYHRDKIYVSVTF